MYEQNKCPWNVAPHTLEEMLKSIDMQFAWEKDNKQKAPKEWHMIVTTKLMADIVQRLLTVETTMFRGA
jgi:hypothetical protein